MKKLADVGGVGVTEDLSAISGKVGMNFSFFVHFFNIFAGWARRWFWLRCQVNQQKAKLIDLEANVTLQEKSNGKVNIPEAYFVKTELKWKVLKLQLSEDLKKMSETLTENKTSMEQKLEKLEGTKKELVMTVSDMAKSNTTLGQELASLTGLKTKAPAWDRKAETTEVGHFPYSCSYIWLF